MRLMTPPLPAASRPSNRMTTLCSGADHPVLQLDQLALQPEQFLEIECRSVLSRSGCSLGVQQIVQPVVVDLHFQLFVEAVGDFGIDALGGAGRSLSLGFGHGALSLSGGRPPRPGHLYGPLYLHNIIPCRVCDSRWARVGVRQ